MKPPTSRSSLRSLTSLIPSRSSFFAFLVVDALLLVSCSTREFHIYPDTDYGKRIEARFNVRKAQAGARETELFGVFKQELTNTEKEGLKFLYAYMPLSDLADYDGGFFLNQVRWSLAARDAFTWGKSVPEDLFRHFVLPYRVNNENLDTARIVFFNGLKDRIKNMTMLNAALEVNHWCHEKMTYRGSDIRTSAPLASLRTAYGRCGEESTFAVAALRSVSIPARQVYTPRWAHSDDNHAWVEFWADGKWHYMGACEPECVPDLGWFTEPARRAMLIHTKAFGDYKGAERVENRELNFSLINTLPTYAPVKEIYVKVLNAKGEPAKNATVEFQLYNYAEFYPISIKKTDEIGLCSFLTGFGDLLVWAHTDTNFGFKKITVADTDTVRLIADQDPYASLALEFDLIPPIQREPLKIPDDCRDQNNVALRREDSIRGDYEKTFRTEEQTRRFAASLDIDPDRTWNFISRSRGNYVEIEQFLKSADPSIRMKALELLNLISDKDLRDTKAEILSDHLINSPAIPEMTGGPSQPNYAGNDSHSPEFLLNPRIANEMLVAYGKFLTSRFGSSFMDEVRKNPKLLVDWVRKEIKINTEENYYKTPLTPVGVYNLKLADEDSRKIFLVATYRTFGIPARLSPGTLDVQYWDDNHWETVVFNGLSESPQEQASLVLISDPSNPVKPQYETHYTLARYENGKYNTLAYGYDNLVDPLKSPLNLARGYYLLVTGNRIPGGGVLSNLKFFELKKGEKKELMITLRNSAREPDAICTLTPNWPVNPLGDKVFDWKQVLAAGRAIICWMEPDKEPSKHIFQDLGTLKVEIDKLDCPFIFLIPKNKLPAGFSPDTWKNLPGKSSFATVQDLTSLKDLENATGKILAGQLPIIIAIRKDGKVTYLSSGYKIGIGEEIIKIMPGK